MRLYFDVATSRWHTDKETGEEPRVVRIAWWRDDEPDPVCRLISPPANLIIDPSTFRYHAVTLEQLELNGVAPAGVIAELGTAALQARTIVSYNEAYHWRQLHRLMGHVGAPVPTQAVCAMKMATQLMQLPPSRGGGWKSPSLDEACAFYQCEPPSGEGSAVARAVSTVRAVRAIYEAMVRE